MNHKLDYNICIRNFIRWTDNHKICIIINKENYSEILLSLINIRVYTNKSVVLKHNKEKLYFDF